MKHSDLRTLARNLALDRDGAVSGSPAGTDVAIIINDHVTYTAAMRNDRSAAYTSAAGVFSVASGGFSARIGATNILRILSATRETLNSTIDGTPMEIVQPKDIYFLRGKSVTTGTPTKVAFVRLAGASNRFRALVHPPSAAGTFISIRYWPFERELTISPLDLSEVLDLPQHTQYQVVRETAIDIANILGRPDSVLASISTRVPQAEALTAGMLARNMATGPPVDEPA